MIVDSLEQSGRYACTHASFSRAFQFLRTLPADPSDGRHEIDGERLFALVQSYHTTPAAERKLEHHRRYADLQYVFAGEEIIEHAPLGGLPVDTAYDSQRDFGLVQDPHARSAVLLRPGQFAIFFPDDAHKPGCAVAGSAPVRKVVLKVLL